jgi:IS5 family transposase
MNFRHLLEKHNLGRKIFKDVNQLLMNAGVMLREGTLMDATIIEAPTSTKNKEGKGDPEMHQTKKGNQWHFGMKAHIGVDAATGLVHSMETTAANVHDLNQADKLLHGDEEVVFADAGYQGINKREEHEDREVDWFVAQRPGITRALKRHPEDNKNQIRLEKVKASIRAKVEHPFRVIKCQFGFTKARYRGLIKNDTKLSLMFMLANIMRLGQIMTYREQSA